MPKTRFNIELRAVVYREGDWWLAHCLELDIVSEGKTAVAALSDVMDLCRLQVETAINDGDLESVFRAAPPRIWARFARATDMPPPRKPAKPVSRFEAKQLALA